MPMDVFIDLLGMMDMEYLSKITAKNHGTKPPSKR